MVLRNRQRNKRDYGFVTSGNHTVLNVITNTTDKEFQRICSDSEKANSKDWHRQFLNNNKYCVSPIKKEKSNHSVNDQEDNNDFQDLNHHDDNVLVEAREEGDDDDKATLKELNLETNIDKGMFRIPFEQKQLEKKRIYEVEEGFEIIDTNTKVTVNRAKINFQNNYQLQASISSVCSDIINRSLFDDEDDDQDSEQDDDQDESVIELKQMDPKEVAKAFRKIKQLQSLPLQKEYDPLYLDEISIKPRKDYGYQWKEIQEDRLNGYSNDGENFRRLGIPLYNDVRTPSTFPSIVGIKQKYFSVSVTSTDSLSSEYLRYCFCCI